MSWVLAYLEVPIDGWRAMSPKFCMAIMTIITMIVRQYIIGKWFHSLRLKAIAWDQEHARLQETLGQREQELEAVKLELERLKEERDQPWWKKVG